LAKVKKRWSRCSALEPGSSLFDLTDLEDEPAALLGHRVDVVSVGGLKAHDHAIRRDAQWL
jgi:predicted nucleotidyltransferase